MPNPEAGTIAHIEYMGKGGGFGLENGLRCRIELRGFGAPPNHVKIVTGPFGLDRLMAADVLKEWSALLGWPVKHFVETVVLEAKHV
jgi:hypothetical protein